jgi:hypothetical protein
MSLYIEIKTVKICGMLFSQSLHTVLIACAVLFADDNINRL